MALKLFGTHMRANWRAARGDYARAVPLFERLLAEDPSDSWAAAMLAHCHEEQGNPRAALRFAVEHLRQSPSNLGALRMAVRLAVEVDAHEEAVAYVRRALRHPEMVTEMPRESAVPRGILWVLSALSRVPGLRRRFRAAAVDALRPGAQSMELAEWKRWAHEYLAQQEGRDPNATAERVH